MPEKTCLHWATAWNSEILPALNQKRLLIACAFDGVIAPLSTGHADLALFERTRTLFRKLAQAEDAALVFSSGRELPDLKSRIGLHSVSYCGNHGLQIETPDFRWESEPARKTRRSLCAALEHVRTTLAGLRGILLEDRQLSFIVRDEFASEPARILLREALAAIAARHQDLRINQATTEWEIRPDLPINTGAALRFLLERSTLEPPNILILGAEPTDTSAFEAFKESVTIQIGDTPNAKARFRANDPVDVAELLFCIYVARKAEGRHALLTSGLQKVRRH